MVSRRGLRKSAKRRFTTAVLNAVASPPIDTNPELLADGILTIGKHTTGNPEVITYRPHGIGHVGDSVTIGNFCSFGEHVRILAGGVHRVDWVSTFPIRDYFNLPGRFEDSHPSPREGHVDRARRVGRPRGLVHAGRDRRPRAVVGARALVTHDVAPYSIVAGLPGKEIRCRFQPDQVERLLALVWWDWPDEKILGSLNLLIADGGIKQI